MPNRDHAAAPVPATIEVTGAVQHQAWSDNVFPPVERVRPGLWSIPVPIPQNPLRYVLVYGFELDDGIALVDAGWPTDDAWETLVAGLSTAGFAPADVRAVLVTHIHPDHYGLAGRLREASGAWIGMHPADATLLQARYRTIESLVDAQRRMLAESGVPDGELPDLSEASLGIRSLLGNPADPDIMLEDGDEPELAGWRLRVLWTPGHSPGHICFYEPDRRLLLSGDHVLPRITPNVSAHTQQRANPLADFLDSLARVAALDVEEVLPAHEYRFAGVATRVDQLAGHHEDRLREIEQLLDTKPGATTWEMTLRLSWSRSWEEIPHYMRRAAVGETLAHLALLDHRGRVKGEGRAPVRWHRVANPNSPPKVPL
jgi:glyoxylase-like metal-dependent hydrolase (beta-lactamase superfamily II)